MGQPSSPLQHVLIKGQLAHPHERLPGKCCTFPQLFSSGSAVFQLTSVLPSWVLPDSPVPPRTPGIAIRRRWAFGTAGIHCQARMHPRCLPKLCLCSVLSMCFFTRAHHSNSDFPTHHPTDKVRRHYGRSLFRARFPFPPIQHFRTSTAARQEGDCTAASLLPHPTRLPPPPPPARPATRSQPIELEGQRGESALDPCATCWPPSTTPSWTSAASCLLLSAWPACCA